MRDNTHCFCLNVGFQPVLQLQTTFLKAIRDNSKTVRNVAVELLGKIASLGSRVDQLLNDVLGGKLGEMQTMEGVTTTINGMTINGYIDVGRTDTMMDMLVETLGAIVYAVVLVIEKGKYSSFHLLEKKEETKNNE